MFLQEHSAWLPDRSAKRHSPPRLTFLQEQFVDMHPCTPPGMDRPAFERSECSCRNIDAFCTQIHGMHSISSLQLKRRYAVHSVNLCAKRVYVPAGTFRPFEPRPVHARGGAGVHIYELFL